MIPDLRAIITDDLINLAPDLYLRDHVGDDGDPTGGLVSQSPDIIVRGASVADPQTAFGVGSGTENDPALSDSVATGHDHFVYVRALNRGGSEATAALVDVYWSPPATLVTPNLWDLIGTATLASVPPANELTVSDEIVWDSGAIPAPGHHCFVAVAGNPQDPKPNAATFATFDQFVTYVENNNIRVAELRRGPAAAVCRISADEIHGTWRLRYQPPLRAGVDRTPAGEEPRRPRSARMARGRLAATPGRGEVRHRESDAYIPLHPSGVHRLGSAVFACTQQGGVRAPGTAPGAGASLPLRLRDPAVVQEQGSWSHHLALREREVRATQALKLSLLASRARGRATPSVIRLSSNERRVCRVRDRVTPPHRVGPRSSCRRCSASLAVTEHVY